MPCLEMVFLSFVCLKSVADVQPKFPPSTSVALSILFLEELWLITRIQWCISALVVGVVLTKHDTVELPVQCRDYDKENRA